VRIGLLTALAKSSEIFGYYRRAEAGEFVGSTTTPFAKRCSRTTSSNGIARSPAAASRRKAMFKFGANHLYHEKIHAGVPESATSPTNSRSSTVRVPSPVCDSARRGIRTLAESPAWLRTLLPAPEPDVPTLIDLRPLRPYQRLFREAVDLRMSGAARPAARL